MENLDLHVRCKSGGKFSLHAYEMDVSPLRKASSLAVALSNPNSISPQIRRKCLMSKSGLLKLSLGRKAIYTGSIMQSRSRYFSPFISFSQDLGRKKPPDASDAVEKTAPGVGERRSRRLRSASRRPRVVGVPFEAPHVPVQNGSKTANGDSRLAAPVSPPLAS